MAKPPLAENPLLADRFPIPFAEIEPSHVKPAVDTLLAEARQRMAELGALTAPPSFDNTMLALEAVTERLGRAMRLVGHLEGVATSDALREAFNEAQPRVSELLTAIPLSAELWTVVKRYADSDQASELKGARRRFVEKTVAFFKRHGADLDEEGKKRLAAIDVELTKLTLRYSQNVLDATNAFELIVTDDARLSGLPDSAKKAARQSAQEKDKAGYRFTLQVPSYLPLLTYADDATLREQVYRAAVTRATSGDTDNRDIVDSVLALRAEKATVLGYDSFADYVLEDRMAKSGSKARDFVDDLRARTEAHCAQDREQLLAFRRELEGDDAPALQAWDAAYYAEKQRHARYNFDEEALRPYFSLERVLSGLFRVAERLYGLRFEPWDDAPRWHESVQAFKVIDGDEWLAGIYVDVFPRESKQGGAWMDGIVSRGRLEKDTRHMGVLVANVTPPIGDADAQLSHREVETMFHEFGHLMHHCLSRAELRSQAGTHVAWDFVELPSQLMENWCWEREALDLFATHHRDDEPIPDELFEAMGKARTFRAATAQMRQLGFAAADLALHIDFDRQRDGHPVAYARTVIERFSPTELPKEHASIAAFEHLFGDPVGYAAAYYSYKWAEVLDADAFTRFQSEGLFNRETGDAFRRQVLERGDEDDPALLFHNFMGREPDMNALLTRLGIGGKS